jgi:hypothetical protein
LTLAATGTPAREILEKKRSLCWRKLAEAFVFSARLQLLHGSMIKEGLATMSYQSCHNIIGRKIFSSDEKTKLGNP